MRTPKSPTVLGIVSAAALAGLFAYVETTHADQAAPNQFTPLFDGQTLTHWRGDPAYWSVRDGAITGGSTRDIGANTFLIHEGNFRNFELRFKYRFRVPGNSGVQIRSRLHAAHEFAVTGYQANVVTVPPSTNERFAMLYEERGRGMILAALGEQTIVTRTAGKVSRQLLRTVNPPERVLAAEKAYPEWNEQVIIAYENRLVNAFNGMLTADVTDNDVEGRAFDGFIALQGHAGPPMEVQFKDLEIRPLTSAPDLEGRFATAPTPSRRSIMRIMRTPKTLSAVLGIVSAAALAGLVAQVETTHADQAAPKTIVLIGGSKSHRPAEHDHPNGIRLLKSILESSPDIKALNVRVDAYPDGWPADEAVFANAATVVWYFDGLATHPLVDAERRARFARLMDRGVGLVALHQASTLLPDDTLIPLPQWLGSARYGMFDRTTESVGFQPAAHPISRGVGPFTLHDEFYPTYRLADAGKVVPILSAAFNVAMEDGKPSSPRVLQKPAAWTFERANGGRGFAFTGLHYLISLDHPQLRRLLLNAVAWTAGFDVPAAGVRSGLPDAATKVAASVGAQATPPPAPRAPQTAVTKSVVTRTADHQVLPQPWGVLTWYVSRELKNSDTMTVGRAVVRPGQQNPRHYHPNCDEVLQVLQGHILHTMNDVTVEMRAGDVVSIPTGVVHNARNIGTEDAILAISFSSADRQSVGYE